MDLGKSHLLDSLLYDILNLIVLGLTSKQISDENSVLVKRSLQVDKEVSGY